MKIDRLMGILTTLSPKIAFLQEAINKTREITFGFHDRENLFSWVMSFGDKAELLEPKSMREEFRIFVENICRRYT